MEIIIGLIVIFILLLCMGANLGVLATIALGIIGIFVVFMTIVFIYSTVVFITSKKAKGRYIRTEIGEKNKIPFAVYLIDDKEYKNLFPLEVLFQSKIYREDKEVKLFFNENRKCCFDSNAVLCCILGVIVSIFLCVEMILLLLGNI